MRRLVSFTVFWAVLAMAPVTSIAKSYYVKTLGDLGGGSSRAAGINNSGQVVGDSWTTNSTHPFLWDPVAGKMEDIVGIGSPSLSLARAINDRGQVVGESFNSEGMPHAFLYDPATGEVRDIEAGGPFQSTAATAINSEGQVVGYSSYPDKGNAFLWDPSNSIMTNLGALEGTGYWGVSSGLGINSSGQVVGYSITAHGVEHAILWDPSTREMTDLTGASATFSSQALAINDSGQIVGYTHSGGYGQPPYPQHAFLWDPVTRMLQDLGALGSMSRAWAINSLGQVVGETSGHAFLWDPATRQMEDLNSFDLIGMNDQNIWVLAKASGINDKGQIACTGITYNNRYAAVLLTPVIDCSKAYAEPNTLWPPNHTLEQVQVLGISDPSSGDISVQVTGVTQDEPTDGLGDGDTSPDAFILDGKAFLRAERSGKGNGRVYRVAFTAIDQYGQSCSGSVSVPVPESEGGPAAVDDGQKYDSLQ